MIRAIYAYHTLTLGWSDIGYNFLFDRFGRLHEGRWGGLDRPVIGAHTGGFNTNTVGVAALGDHETSPVPGAVMTGFGQLLGWKLGLYGRDPYGRVTLTSGGGDNSRYPAGQAVEFNVISGHRDASFTLYPADIPTRPLASDLNFKGNQVVPNLVVVKLSPDGRFTLASAAPDATHAVIDLLGYYTQGS